VGVHMKGLACPLPGRSMNRNKINASTRLNKCLNPDSGGRMFQEHARSAAHRHVNIGDRTLTHRPPRSVTVLASMITPRYPARSADIAAPVTMADVCVIMLLAPARHRSGRGGEDAALDVECRQRPCAFPLEQDQCRVIVRVGLYSGLP
jgi:hypothetical protein